MAVAVVVLPAFNDFEDGVDTSASVGANSLAPVDGAEQLPFGLRVADGTTPLGRPAAFDGTAYLYNDEPVEARMLRAAYQVTADDYAKVGDIAAVGLDGVEVIRRSFNIPAGGWSFEMVAVRQPDEPFATIYVTSWPG